jgi:hypothetical protein
VRGRLRFRLHRYRAERMRELEREVDFLRAERQRLEALLADAVLVAAGRDCDPLVLLGVLGELRGFEPARAAVFDQRRELESGHCQREAAA